MTIQILNVTVSSGATYTYPDDNTQGGAVANMGLSDNEYHMISISGAGTGTITADQGSGYQAIGTLTADYNTYLIPLAQGIKVAAAGGDIVLSMKSYSEK